MIKPIAAERMLESIIYHSKRLNKMLADDINITKEDEDKLRDAYNTILRLYDKVYEEHKDKPNRRSLLI